MKKAAALLFLIAILTGFLLHFADLIDLDNYCETDADCKRPKVCRLVCRRDCKSVCVHVVDEVNDSLGGRGGGGSFDAIWWTKKPDSAVTSRRKLHRRPVKSDEDRPPFDTEANPFAAAAVPFRSPQAPLPPPSSSDKKSKEPITPLTISEAELEAELRQLTGPDRGPSGFVTAPGGSGEDSRTTADPFEPKSGQSGSSKELFATAPPLPSRNRGSGRTQQSTATTISQQTSRHLVLSTSMELIGDPQLFSRHRAAVTILFTTVSPPSFSPQPPGLMPSQQGSTLASRQQKSTTTVATSSGTTATTSRTTTTPAPRTTTTTDASLLGRMPPAAGDGTSSSGEQQSKEHSIFSGEEFEQQQQQLSHKAGGPYYKPLFYKNGEREGSPWLPKTPLVRPPHNSVSTTMPPPPATTFPSLLVAMRRTTQRVPVHRPFGGWQMTTTPQSPPTTGRTTLRKCVPPPVCGRNCGVVIDWDGCQSCQCLWTSKVCFSDVDCRSFEGQVCDLGRCECGPGYEHHPELSGICRRTSDLPARQRGVPLSQSSAIPPSPSPPPSASSSPPAVAVLAASTSSPPPPPSSLLISGRSQHQVPADRQFHHNYSYHRRQMLHRLFKRMADPKPHREERLQWPGPCDTDEQCPPQLYCVEGDCWTLEPERVLQRRKDSTTIGGGGGSHAAALARAVGPSPVVAPPHKQWSQQQRFPLQPLVGPAFVQKYTTGTNKSSTTVATLISSAPVSPARNSAFIQEPHNPPPPSSSQQQRPAQQFSLPTAQNAFNPIVIPPPPPMAAAPLTNPDEEDHLEEQPFPEEAGERANGGGDDYSSAAEDNNHLGNAQQRQSQLLEESAKTTTTTTTTSSSFPRSTARSAVSRVRTTAAETSTPASAAADFSSPVPAGDISFPDFASPLFFSSAPVSPPPQPSSSAVTTVALPGAIVPLNGDDAQQAQKPPTQLRQPTHSATRSKADDLNEWQDGRSKLADGELRLTQQQISSESEATTEATGSNALAGNVGPQQPRNQQARFEHQHISSRGRGLESIPRELELQAEAVTTTTLPATEEKGRRRIFYDYSRRNRIKRPIRVEMRNSREFMRDECHQDRDCGRRFVCCLKRWCDLGGECGVARFCLPSCELTKLAHLSELGPSRGLPSMDLVYD